MAGLPWVAKAVAVGLLASSQRAMRPRLGAWGAVNAQRGAGALGRLLHALWGLDHYPRYLERWSDGEIADLERELEATLAKVRAQRADRATAARDSAKPTLFLKNQLRVRDVVRPAVARALGWDPEAGVEDAVAAGARRAKDADWLAVLEEAEGGASGVYSLDFLAPAFCATLVRSLEEEAQPAQGTAAATFPRANLDHLGLGWLADLCLLVARECSRRLYGAEDPAADDTLGAQLDWRHAYVLDYQAAGARQSLVSHTDDSEVTLNVALRDEAALQGGHLLVGGLRGARDEKRALAPLPRRAAGTAVIHRGRTLHAVSPVTGGQRAVLICWCRALQGPRTNICPCCWMNRRHDGQVGDCICGPVWNS